MSAQETIDYFKEHGQKDFDSCYAYAVFPKIASGAVGVGAKGGKGEVFVGGQKIGEVDYSGATFGGLGFETWKQIIFLDSEDAFNTFTSGKYELKYDVKLTAGPASAGAGVGTTAPVEGNIVDAGGAAYIKGMKVIVAGAKGLYVCGNPGAGELGTGKYTYTAM